MLVNEVYQKLKTCVFYVKLGVLSPGQGISLFELVGCGDVLDVFILSQLVVEVDLFLSHTLTTASSIICL